MKTVRDLLRAADPLRHETNRLESKRHRLRQAVVAGASGVTGPPAARFSGPLALLVTIVLLVVGIVAIGAQFWLERSSTLQAQVRFEVRLAEEQATAGLREARINGSDRVVYLHNEIIVTNADIEQSHIAQGTEPARFSIGVQFSAAGAEKMRQATERHVGRPIAILIDGNVVSAPVVRSVVSTEALFTGDYTRQAAERIVNGIGIR